MEKDRERDGTGVCSFPLFARLDNGLVRMTWLASGLAGWFVVRHGILDYHHSRLPVKSMRDFWKEPWKSRRGRWGIS